VIALAAGQAELEQRIFRPGLDLGRQHPARRPPGVPLVSTTVEDQDPTADQGQLPGAGGPDCTAADYDNIRYGSHL
jgi:hypothetical protein